LPVAGCRRGDNEQTSEANEGKDFSATQASVFLDGFLPPLPRGLLRRERAPISVIDEQLLRSSFLPALADVALVGLRPWNRRDKGARAG